MINVYEGNSIYSDSHERHLIGTFETMEEATLFWIDYVNNKHPNVYSGFSNQCYVKNNVTYIDFGSWHTFIYLEEI